MSLWSTAAAPHEEFVLGRLDSPLYGGSPAASALVDSRFRGNDDSKVIPAKAGIH